MKTVADMRNWQGRIDAEEGPAGRRWHQVMVPVEQLVTPALALLGFACDAGVARNHGRVGARAGPAALRPMLANLPVRDSMPLADAGDVCCVASHDDDQLESAQQELAQAVAGLLAHGHRPVVLGGGHEMAFGSFSGLAQFLDKSGSSPRIGIVNLDAHFDLRQGGQATSGTPFRQIAEFCRARGWAFNYCCVGISVFANTQALFDRAVALDVRWLLDEELTAANAGHTENVLADFLGSVDHVYFTTCLDVLPSAVAPGVSAPAARGVPLEIIEPIIDMVAGSGKLRLADIAELNPQYDIDQRTARVAARLVARIAHAWSKA